MSRTWASLSTPILKKQRAGSRRLFQFDVGSLAVPPWQPAMSVLANAVIRPTQDNQTGYLYQAGSNGQTGDTEPGWAQTLGGTTTDGSLTFNAIAPPSIGEDSVASIVFTQVSPPDSALTITPGTNTQLVAEAWFAGGTSGNVYTINAAITMTSGAIYVPQIILTVI
jgi:hypothetical protein